MMNREITPSLKNFSITSFIQNDYKTFLGIKYKKTSIVVSNVTLEYVARSEVHSFRPNDILSDNKLNKFRVTYTKQQPDGLLHFIVTNLEPYKGTITIGDTFYVVYQTFSENTQYPIQ